MNLTQVAGSQIGVLDLYDDTGRAKPSSPIVLIVDPQTHNILDYITTKNIIRDNHKKSLEDTLETFTMTTFADKRFSQHLEKRNRIIIPDEDNNLVEFVPFEIVKYRDSEGHKIQVYSHASYLEIKKANVIYPDIYEGTATQHLGRALNNTGWRLGTVESGGNRTIRFDNHTNPFAYIKRIARELDLEPKFRIEHDGAKITGRYVDLLERVGAWRNRTVEFGKDLQGIRRVEKQDIYTALLGVMPEDEEGNQRTVLVEDEEALQRWGRIDEHGELQHLIGTHVIQSTRTEMTEEEAIQYTRTELDKRINTTVTYEANIVDLEHVPGMQNKKIRHGDTIRIKDTKFNPPLYLEARVFESEGSIKERGNKKVKLGDFVEFTQEEVDDIWRSLREQIRKRITAAELAEYTYNKIVIDDKDEAVRTDVESYANTVSSEAKDEAIIYTNNTIDPIVVTVDDIEVDLDDVKSDVSDTISQISQLSDRVSVVVAENGTINAETIASELSVTPSAIDLISDNITLSANQINFDGHVFGEDATFTGRIEGAEIVGSTLTSYDSTSNDVVVVGGGSVESYTDGELTVGIGKGLLSFYNRDTDETGRFYSTETVGANPAQGLVLSIEKDMFHISFPEPSFQIPVFSSDSSSPLTTVSGPPKDATEGSRLGLYANGLVAALGNHQDQPSIYMRQGPTTNSMSQYFGGVNRRSGATWDVRFRNSPTGYQNRIVAHDSGVKLWREVEVLGDLRVNEILRYNRNSTPDFSGSANLRLSTGDTASEARIGLIGSRRELKRDIEPLDITVKELSTLNPVRYKDKNEYKVKGEESPYYLGFIAEEVAESDIPELVDFNDERKPMSVNYDRFAIALLNPLLNHEDRITEIEAENQLLKNEIKILKERMA